MYMRNRDLLRTYMNARTVVAREATLTNLSCVGTCNIRSLQSDTATVTKSVNSTAPVTITNLSLPNDLLIKLGIDSFNSSSVQNISNTLTTLILPEAKQHIIIDDAKAATNVVLPLCHVGKTQTLINKSTESLTVKTCLQKVDFTSVTADANDFSTGGVDKTSVLIAAFPKTVLTKEEFVAAFDKALTDHGLGTAALTMDPVTGAHNLTVTKPSSAVTWSLGTLSTSSNNLLYKIGVTNKNTGTFTVPFTLYDGALFTVPTSQVLVTIVKSDGQTVGFQQLLKSSSSSSSSGSTM
jgi:hypothetical protein